MSEERDNTNRGALFGNTRKREGKKDPDLQGRIDIAGVEHWISGWFFKYTKDGAEKEAISLALGDEVQKKEEKRSEQKKPAGKFDDDSDVPF